jgi:holo-[acyl-carrier protein] synthase
MKALGTGLARGVSWQDISVDRESGHPPVINMSGKARELAEEKGALRTHLSISHSDIHATAFVVLEGG